ncbi:MAG: histidine utilization repressor [Gammaproteobacteria bacterium]|nr:histidine utilization repressor [Gammaproteobacteria bacterium]
MSKPSVNMRLSGDDSVPMYQQIKDAIRLKISSREWQAGQIIPSENQLVEALGVSRMTINRPLRELTAEGLLRRVHGLGTFVAEPQRQAHLIELVSIADEIQQQGKTHRAQVLAQQTIKADTALSDRMQLTRGTDVFKAVLVHYQDNVPIQLEFRFLNPILVPGFVDVDFNATTPADYLIATIRPDELEHVVQAIMPDDFIAQQLDIPHQEPCLKLRRRTWKGSGVVTSVDLVYPSSRYELGARYAPSSSN